MPGGARVWFVSEADGYAHLYSASTDGSDRRQLTKGRWEVEDVELSNDRKYFELHTSAVSPYERHFYRMPIAGGAAKLRPSPGLCRSSNRKFAERVAQLAAEQRLLILGLCAFPDFQSRLA